MQISLPDHPRIASQAAASGFATVEDYVRHLIDADAGLVEEPQKPGRRLSHAEWKLHLNKLLSLAEPGNPNVDDSRESIYPVR